MTVRKQGVFHPNVVKVAAACMSVASSKEEGKSLFCTLLVLRHGGYLFAKIMTPRWQWRRHLFLLVRADKQLRFRPGELGL